MKKSLLTAALVAGFAATGAQAETSVTLYGVLDGGVQYQKFKGTDAAGNSASRDYVGAASGVNSGNRWGLKGSEDLGNGLKAVFTLESGFNIGTGQSEQGNRLFGRQATVGLQSDAWGLVEIGRQTNIASKYFAGVASPFGTDFGQANIGSAFSAAGSQRYDNMLMYQTPKFAGFQFGLGYSFNANGAQSADLANGDNPNTRAWTTGLRYGNGPLEAALTYDSIKQPDTARSPVRASAWALALSYDFEVVKVHAAGGQTRNGWFAANSSLNGADAINGVGPRLSSNSFNDDLKVNSYTLGLSAPIGANSKIMASWMMADPSSSGVNNWGDDKQNVYSLGYTYNLSKRTNLYALASYANGVNFQDDLKATQVVAGVRHRF
ncbi:porin [Neopusillimonas aromaticivorans]|uniref:porin n=1 Tax=Neopusillimonas aromaticivorans TaxID=2979868 RepID=UPI002598021D|nr:porin [Neopusillimonas aromaticivorans]WJJ93068.1 porin [Neopusillimonas aromaticivorans]